MVSRTSVLPSKHSSEEATQIALASLVIKARLLAAASTFAHIDVGRTMPGKEKTAWPHFLDEKIVGHSGGYENNGKPLALPPVRRPINRTKEVNFVWLAKLLRKDENRIVLVHCALCVAAPALGGAFRAWCKETGSSLGTADRRANFETQAIAKHLFKSAQSARELQLSRVVPILPE